MKRTSDSQWVHVLCALLLGARFKDPVNKEPINVLALSRPAVKLECCYCNQNNGAFLKCHDRRCDALFHVTCGLLTGAMFAVSQSENHEFEVRVCFVKLSNAFLEIGTNVELAKEASIIKRCFAGIRVIPAFVPR